MFHANPRICMKYQVLFSPKNNEKLLKTVQDRCLLQLRLDTLVVNSVQKWGSSVHTHEIQTLRKDSGVCTGFKINSSKFATGKSHLLPAKNVGSKKLLPGNSVIKVISWKNKPIFTEITLPIIRQNTIPYGQRHYQCL